MSDPFTVHYLICENILRNASFNTATKASGNNFIYSLGRVDSILNYEFDYKVQS